MCDIKTFDFPAGTTDGVKMALLTAYMTGRRVRLFFSYSQDGEVALEDYDVIGYIRRPVGAYKQPILIHNRRSYGGGAISTDRVVRIIDVATKKDLYRADNYRMPVLTVCEPDAPIVVIGGPTYTHEVYRGLPYRNAPVARFTSKSAANNWVAWQQGKRMRAY